MSCDVAVAAFLMFASASPADAPKLTPAVAAAPPSVAGEPLFKDIVDRAGRLRTEVQAYRSADAGQTGAVALPKFDAFQADVGQLAALDEKGHQVLVARGSADDLKCILHGIAQDLPAKLSAMMEAKTAHDQDLALRDMDYLLRDNVEVITAPPQPAA